MAFSSLLIERSVVSFLLTTLFLGCSIIAPKTDARKKNHDPLIVGSWSDQDTTAIQKYHHVYRLDSSGYLRISEYYHDNPLVAGVEMTYFQGEWFTSCDTVFFSYTSYQYTSFGYRPVDTIQDAANRFRVNDECDLCISSYLYDSWTCYHKTDGNCVQRDTTGFVTTAMPDTEFAPKETVIFSASARSPGASVTNYAWSFDGGLHYKDTTIAGSISKFLGIADTGLHVGAVKALDDKGNVSKPDFFEFRVHSYHPAVLSRDTVLLCFQPAVAAVSAFDTNGTIRMYYWTKNGSQWNDSSPSGSITINDTCGGTSTLYVKVRDDDGLYSPIVSMTIKLLPTLTIGTARNETGGGMAIDGSGSHMLFGTQSNSGFGSKLLFIYIDSSGHQIARDSDFINYYNGAYWNNYGYSIVSGAVPDFFACGTTDIMKGEADSGFIVCVSSGMKISWTRTFKDQDALGAELLKIVKINDNSFIAAGHSEFMKCDTISRTATSITTSCYPVWKPFVVCINQAGMVSWQATYADSVRYEVGVALTSSNDLIFTSGNIVKKISTANGDTVWTVPLNFYGCGAASLSNGFVAVVGYMQSLSYYATFDGNGTFQNQVSLGALNFTDVKQISPDRVVVFGPHAIQCLTLSGQEIWSLAYTYLFIDAVEVEHSGAIAVAGHTDQYGNGKNDMIFFKLSPEGDRLL